MQYGTCIHVGLHVGDHLIRHMTLCVSTFMTSLIDVSYKKAVISRPSVHTAVNKKGFFFALLLLMYVYMYVSTKLDKVVDIYTRM